MTESLGNPLDLISPGIIPKIYPSCSLTHPALDLILALKKERTLAPEAVRRVRCGVDYRWVKTLPYHSPQLPHTGLEGKFSMEFCIAVAISEGKAGIDQFTDERAKDPKIQSLMKKIDVYTHPDLVDRKSLGKGFTLLEIELQNGEKISRRAGKPKGDPTNPLSWEEITEKYRDCSNRVLSDQVTRESLGLLQEIDQLPEVTRIMNLLSKT
jgi:2-methylcitrate dehydratase PrpD